MLRPAFLAALACAVLLSACVTEKTEPGRLRTIDPDVVAASEKRRQSHPAAGRGQSGTLLEEPVADPAGRSFTAQVLSTVVPLGSVPYDDNTLPLVSPDGRLIATQVGIAPDWSTILAERGASVPYLARVEIYALPDVKGGSPDFVAEVNEPVLLGRACDRDGFLVEAPREDGSRWIGYASWRTGAVRWLVNDPGTVNAFATLGAGGRLAFSRRAIDGEHFDLVVRHGFVEWELPGQSSDWLMPIWGGGPPAGTAVDAGGLLEHGDGLFVLMLRGDMLDVVHMDATNLQTARRTIRRIPLANDNATVDTAFQTLNATAATVSARPARRDRLIYFHPSRFRVTIWQPPDPPVALDRASIVAATDPGAEDFVVISVKNELVRRHVTESVARHRLLTGPHLPRPTANRERPFILLVPGDGSIEISALVLLYPGSVVGE